MYAGIIAKKQQQQTVVRLNFFDSWFLGQFGRGRTLSPFEGGEVMKYANSLVFSIYLK